MKKDKKNVITLLFVVIAITSCQNLDKEIHYIPKGFTGNVYIIFDQHDGTPKNYKNGYRIYHIPEDGVLKTQFKKNTGIVTRKDVVKFYYTKEYNAMDELDWNYKLDSLWYKDTFKVATFEHGYLFTKNTAVFHYVVDTLKNKGKYNISPKSMDHINQFIN